jgi:hypothetical protein
MLAHSKGSVFLLSASGDIHRTYAVAVTRRAKALGCHYEARLRGLIQATKVAFVIIARPFMGWAAAWNAATPDIHICIPICTAYCIPDPLVWLDGM